MRKSVTKIVKATVAFAMAIGMGVGISVNGKAAPLYATDYESIASFDFSETAASGTTSTSLTADTIKTLLNDSSSVANLVSSVTNKTGDVYSGKGNGGGSIPQRILKIGKASGGGAFTFTISGSDNVSKVVVNGHVWKTTSTISVNGADAQTYSTAQSASAHPFEFELASPTKTITIDVTTSAVCVSSIDLFKTASSGVPTTYTGVEVSQKTALTGTYKGEAYYECQAAVSGTGDYSSDVTWSITSSNTYGNGTSITNVASIDSNGKITFLDNVNSIYVWATAADGTTHNSTGFSVSASGLLDNPITSWTLITDDADVSTNGIYTLSNDKVGFGTTAVVSKKIALTNSLAEIGYFALEPATGGYYLRYATYNDVNSVWEANGSYVNYSGSGADLSTSNSGSTVWTLEEDGQNGVFLRISGGRHLGLSDTGAEIKAYAHQNIETNVPVYLYEAGSLPVINCDTIELTGKPSDPMSLGDTATLGYYALGTDANVWTGDVVYSISNESTSGVVELSATSGASVTLTAKKAGTARVSVRDKDENAAADYVDITVLADPERTELPVGNYDVEIDYSGVKKDDEVPASKSYEIKAKEGTGAGRVWYKNMTIAYSNVTASYDTEYTFSKNGSASTATVTTTSDVTKVTQLVISYYDAKRLTLTDASSNVIAVSSSSNNVCTYVLNSPSFTLSSTTTTTSIYSMQITFTAVNENEEFLSLVINKGVTATSFTEGDAPSSTGLTVHENYSTDGSSISRYEDVTASVTWNYSIETIGEKTTSYTVTATYGGHTSAPVTIDGFTVTPIAKYSLFESSIVEGDYIIYYNGKALQNSISSNRATYSEIEPKNNMVLTNDEDIVWHIAQDGDYYTIYNAAEGKFLASTGSKNQAKLESSVTDNSRWTVEMSNGNYEFINKARAASGSDPTSKYLRENGTYGWACYADTTGDALTLYRATVDTYLKSASTVATYTEEVSGNILRLGSSISVEKWASILAIGVITDYGVMIYKTDSEANITSKTPVEDAYRNSGVTPAIARKGNGVPPTATDGNYVFTARVKVANADTVFCAASFVVIGGQYYFFNEQHVTARGLGA